MYSGPATGLWTSPNPWANVPAGSLKTADDVVFTAPGVIEPRRGFDELEDSLFGSDGSLADAFAYYGEAILLAYDFTRIALRESSGFVDFDQTFAPPGNNRLRFEPAARCMFFNPVDGVRVWDGVGTPSLANASAQAGISFAFDGGSGTLDVGEDVTNGTVAGAGSSIGGASAATGTLYLVTVGGSFNNNDAITGLPSFAASVDGSNSIILAALSAEFAGWAVGQQVTGRTSLARGVISANTVVGSYRVLTLTTVTGTFVDETIDLSNGPLKQPYAAGCPQPLGIVATPVYDADGWMDGNTSVAYRFTVCRKDAFGRVIEGPPSGRTVVVNSYPQAIGNMVGSGTTATFGSTAFTDMNLQVGDVISISPGEANFPAGSYTITAELTPGVEYTYTQAAVVGIVNNTVAQQILVQRNIDLDLTLPVQSTDQISTNNFLRVYRSEMAEGSTSPSDEMFLCYESPFLTAAEVSTGEVSFTDTTPESVLEVPLYTNPNTGDGTLAANFQPPVAEDIVFWQNQMWYLNTRQRHSCELMLLGTGSPDGLQDSDTITFIPDDPAQTTVTLTAKTTPAAPTDFQVFTDNDPAYNIQRTAQSLIAVLNTVTDTPAYGYYVSSESGSPGKMRFEAPNFTSFTGDGSFKVYSSRATAWTPQLPSTTSPLWPALATTNDRHAARLCNSKLDQPEAVPLTNFIQIDADDAPGLRAVPLNYRNIVFKTDGIYAVPNTVPLTYQKISDAVLLAPDSVQRLGDSLYFLSDSGLMVVDDSGVREVGRPIDLALNELNSPDALADVQQRTVGVSYRSEDLYALFLPVRAGDVVTDDNNQAYVDCRKGDGFTRWVFGIRFGVVDPNQNRLVVAPLDNRLWIERKSLTHADYYDVNDAPIPCRVTFNPFTSGEPAVMKEVQQVSLLFRENTSPVVNAELSTEIHPTAETVALTPQGWGDAPWGQTPWGGDPNPLLRVQPLPPTVANGCQLSVGFSVDCEGTKFVFLGVDVDAVGDTRQNRG